GFPPLKINGKKIEGGLRIEVDGTESSQYLSAILLISPFFQKSSSFNWNPHIGSASYNLMTLATMQDLGFEYQINQMEIEVEPIQKLKSESIHYTIEADWSSAAFFYEALALRKKGKILLKKLKFPSIQGDSVLKDWMLQFGVVSNQKDEGLEICYQPERVESNLHFDCSQYPDLVPALVALASQFNFPIKFSGLSKLNFKESKRLDELIRLLQQLNITHQADTEHIHLLAKGESTNLGILDTAKDHRLVMAYAMLAFQFKKVSLNETHWVDKSFPNFWNELTQLGLTIQE
ncbi:MAG: 3-phosphoshikimate 1-carboxyvinyltransferase, partial [Bacteroidia bacterium]